MADQGRSFLTEAAEFRDVSRGNPKPHTLKGEDLVKAQLTPETWRLEIISDGTTKIEKPCTLEAGTAIDFKTIEEMGREKGVRFLKAMQCLNIAQPLGQGLWEGVTLREVLKLAGKLSDIRRVYYWGFHNNDPKQLFQSSLGYNQVMETPPGELPVFLAYKLNGEPISLIRGGPVRVVVPWAHGFKSIKWLQRIVLTNDFKANDTYADGNNDPDSYLKTMARIDDPSPIYKAGKPILLTGVAMVGWSGLQGVEYWLREDAGTHGRLEDGDPAWQKAEWKPCEIDPGPADWSHHLPNSMKPGDIMGFDRETGKPKEWPMRYSIAHWSIRVPGLAPGAYEFRVRSVDRNGYAQPEPRPYPKSGRNEIECRTIMVSA